MDIGTLSLLLTLFVVGVITAFGLWLQFGIDDHSSGIATLPDGRHQSD